MGVSSLVVIAFSVFLISPIVVGATRPPRSDNERSLLYWRYLCESQAQSERTLSQGTELSCKEQGWKVISTGDQVFEVVEDAKN